MICANRLTTIGSSNVKIAVGKTISAKPMSRGRRFSVPAAAILALLLLAASSNLWASIAIDANASANGAASSSSITSPAITTTSGNELLLAFIATDYVSGTNTKVNSVTGGGLTWVLVKRTNVQSGSSEIWRAFATAPVVNATVLATLSNSCLL